MAVLSAATFSVRSWTKTSSAANAPIINMIEAVRVSLNVIIAAPVAATSRAVSLIAEPAMQSLRQMVFEPRGALNRT